MFFVIYLFIYLPMYLHLKHFFYLSVYTFYCMLFQGLIIQLQSMKSIPPGFVSWMHGAYCLPIGR